MLLWSKRPWQAVEVIAELEEIGSAITGKTHLGGALVRIVGICIPYHFANPYGSEPRAKPWSLHEVFLEKLSPLLATWRSEGDVIVLGDFNRRIPRAWGPKHAYSLLEAAFQGYELQHKAYSKVLAIKLSTMPLSQEILSLPAFPGERCAHQMDG